MTATDVGAYLALLAGCVFLLGLVGLIEPALFFGARNREHVVRGLVGCGVLFIVGLVIVVVGRLLE